MTRVIVMVALALVALLLFLTAYAIRVKGQVHLIAGYDVSRTRDNAGLARWIGGGAFVLGLITVGFAVVHFFKPDWIGPAVGVYVAAVSIGCGILSFGARRYHT